MTDGFEHAVSICTLTSELTSRSMIKPIGGRFKRLNLPRGFKQLEFGEIPFSLYPLPSSRLRDDPIYSQILVIVQYAAIAHAFYLEINSSLCPSRLPRTYDPRIRPGVEIASRRCWPSSTTSFCRFRYGPKSTLLPVCESHRMKVSGRCLQLTSG